MVDDSDQRVMVLADRVRVVHRLGGTRIHLMRVAYPIHEVRALCGRVIGTADERADDGRYLVAWLNDTSLSAGDVCKRCVTVAREQAPATIMLQPYTRADRRREQREVAQTMERIFPLSRRYREETTQP